MDFYLQGHIGGRVTLFQTTLPNIGPGELKKREDGQKSSPKVSTVQGKRNNITHPAGLFKHCFCYFSFIHPHFCHFSIEVLRDMEHWDKNILSLICNTYDICTVLSMFILLFCLGCPELNTGYRFLQEVCPGLCSWTSCCWFVFAVRTVCGHCNSE